MFSFEFSLNIRCKIRLGWRTQRWNLSIRGWFTWCLLSFVKIQGINLTICHALLYYTRTSYRCKQFGPINVRWLVSYVMKKLQVLAGDIFTILRCQKYKLTLYVNGLVGFNHNISRFQPLELKEGELVSPKLHFWQCYDIFANWSKWCLPRFKNECVMNGNFAFC